MGKLYECLYKPYYLRQWHRLLWCPRWFCAVL